MGSNSIDGKDSSHGNHIAIFAFMSKGHTIPLLHFARRLLRHPSVDAVTVFTTPGNRPFIASFLSGTAASVISIPFSHGIPDISQHVESTDQLPSMSLFYHFASATQAMQKTFEEELRKLLPVRLLVSDGFLWWTLESANKFGIPRMVFFGMNVYASSVYKAALEARQLRDKSSDDPVTLGPFPWITVAANDVEQFPDPQSDPVLFSFRMNSVQSALNSYGLLVNSFEELEPVFLEYWRREIQSMTRCVGPLCLVDSEPLPDPLHHPDKPHWIQWLDQKLEDGAYVLYVAFGSQAEISSRQLKEIAIGLEKSHAHFMWVVKDKKFELEDGFEDRVKCRGLVVRDWVDQRSILMHPSVKGFLSHCGWNSVMESICAGVPILGWPVMAEQPLNAKMVVEELRIGIRVDGPPFRGGDDVGVVEWEEVEKKVRELMEGETGKMARKKVEELAYSARQAVEEGGSSWRNLNSLIGQLCK